jgi:UDP-N-acetylglucosamine 2-epimerase (non-hydrolysing)
MLLGMPRREYQLKLEYDMRKKILIVFGTRPEAIKMAPLVKKLEEHTADFEHKVCITAQHREMLDQVLRIFNIIPDYDLDIMKPDQDLFSLTSSILLGMNRVLFDFNPDIVLVHGDTTTTFCSTLASYYRQIPVGHVEAGLRTGNIYAPWPEEVNRKLTGAIARYHFAPTELAKKNLEHEGVSEHIYVTGNTVIDALQMAVGMIRESGELQLSILNEVRHKGYPMNPDRKLILITGHRRENFGEGFKNICEAILILAKKYPGYDLVYPVHFNPNVRKPVFDMLGNSPNIYLMEPLDYLPFIYLMERSHLVLTDSGGIQEEAPGFGKPVIVMRETTERPEAVYAGTVRLAGTDKNKIINEVSLLIDDHEHYRRMSNAHNPYGDGKAAGRIVTALKSIG